jgi:hypothetical protein
MRQDWFSREAEPDAPLAPSTPGMPEAQRSLDDILKEREMQTPAIPNPTGQPAPAEPMSLKELSQLMESAAKALLDAKLTIEKAHTALSKVGAMSGPSGTDKEIAGKSQGYAANVKKMGDSIEALAKDISAYRESLSRPKGSWLE